MLHLVHGGIIAVGVLVIAWLLRPSTRPDTRRAGSLRSFAADGRLVEHAQDRAAEYLARELGPECTELAPECTGRVGVRYALAAASLSAAIVHAAVGPEHFTEGLRFGMFFVLLSIAQLAFVPLIIRRPARWLLIAGAVINAGTVILWALTRTVGLPFDLARVEAVGRLDLVATLAELVLIGGCVRALMPTEKTRTGHPAEPPRAGLFVARRPVGVIGTRDRS